MKKIIKMAFGVILLSTASCGHRKTDPLDNKYKNMIKNSIPVDKNQVPKTTQVYVIPGLITVNSKTEFNFTVGEPAEYKLVVAVDDGKSEIDLAKSDELPWLNLEKSKDEKNTWIVSGTPPVDYLPLCQADNVTAVNFEIKILKTPDAATEELLKGRLKTFERSVRVHSSKKTPVILCVSENCAGPEQNLSVTNGENKDFEVIVQDESVSDSKAPELIPYFNPNSRSQERKEISGASFVLLQDVEPKNLGNSKWLFKMSFNTLDLSIKNLKQELTPMAFSLIAKSASCTYSPEKLVHVELHSVIEKVEVAK